MRALSFLVFVALTLPPAASAHGGGGDATGFTSTVSRVAPEASGLELRVLDGDDRLFLENRTAGEVVVLGYSDEPYLRFANGAVYWNVRSPAVYLNADRYALGQVPESADSGAVPAWRRIALGDSYQWHDHRIQWMSTIPPDEIRADPKMPRHVFDWEVLLRVGGTPTVVSGSLDYAPADGGPTTWVIVAATAPVLAALLGWLVFRRRLEAATE